MSLTQLNYDGSKTNADLIEQSKSVFAEQGSGSGERFQITSAGDLDVLDNEGLIATASRLPQSPSPGEC